MCEYCNDQEENIITAFFGVGGKTLPICRGEGVDQPQLLQLARKGVGSCTGSDGDGNDCRGYCQTMGSTRRSAGWINVHSEAGIFQNKHALGGRSNGREAEIGRLKWGTAKMIVHNPCYDVLLSEKEEGDGKTKAPRGPVVIPFYVSGMDTVTPLNENKRLIQPIPVPGHKVKVRFGPELRFDDLIEEYERKEGKKLRRYHCCSDPYCQEARVAEEALALNVRVSSALVQGFEKLSSTLQSAFWRVVAGSGVYSPPASSPHSSSRESVCSNSHSSGRKAPEGLMYDSVTWVSTPQEKELYHLVMLRIEAAMQKLCDENQLEVEGKLEMHQAASMSDEEEK